MHTVSLHINKFFGTHRLEVDGNPIYKKLNWVVGAKDMMVDIGKKEKHRIRVSLHIPVLPGFRTWEATYLLMVNCIIHISYKRLDI